MGTRADFYLGRGPDAVWLGSVAFDGYPSGFDTTPDLFKACYKADWLEQVRKMLAAREDASTPEHGWPWPWKDSNTTDYAYAFDGGVVYGNSFGHGWWPVLDGEAHPEEPGWCGDEKGCKGPHLTDSKPTPFPQMRTDKATLGPRSGLLVISVAGK